MQIAMILALVTAGSLFVIALNTGTDISESQILRWIRVAGSISSVAALLVALQLLSENGKSIERQDRAYVLVKDALINYTDPGGPLARIELVNFGKTPAFELSGKGDCKVMKWPTSENVSLAEIEITKDTTALGPAVGKTSYIKCPDTLDVAGLAEGTSAIVVRGEYTYRDVFDKERTGSFTRMVGGSYGIDSNKMTQLGSDSAN
ncbi:hypothetical protein [Tardiphaga robiniae]|uniref:Uncharacterized protein n=1 Tax=Tardiphaga robiniae TaxID=943830 RepID=A0A7G6TVH7_9BRAD|nr:hypothetical protein [Tardiphaga robiniae]QND70759.1 hypothetical protein HB776_05565 [Tardiphaga robiniae]